MNMHEDRDTDEDDYEGYFLQPANEYNIVDKINLANQQLLASPHYPNEENVPRVKFREELVDFEPDYSSDDGYVDSFDALSNSDQDNCGNAEQKNPSPEEIQSEKIIEIKGTTEVIEEVVSQEVAREEFPEVTLREIESTEVTVGELETEEFIEEEAIIEEVTVEEVEIIYVTEEKASTKATNEEVNIITCNRSSEIIDIVQQDELNYISTSLAMNNSIENTVDEFSDALNESSVESGSTERELVQIAQSEEDSASEHYNTTEGSFTEEFICIKQKEPVQGRLSITLCRGQRYVPNCNKLYTPVLKLKQRDCCENNAYKRILPNYNGFNSEYGLTEKQLKRIENLKEKCNMKQTEKLNKYTEEQMIKDKQNEDAFAAWLKNKLKLQNNNLNKNSNFFNKKYKSNY